MSAEAIANPSLIKTIILVAVAAAVPCSAQDSSTDQRNGPVWSRAIDIGGVDVELPHPSFDDSFSEPQQAKSLREVAGKYPLDRFTRNSIVAPFTLKRENIKTKRGSESDIALTYGSLRMDLWMQSEMGTSSQQ